MSFIPQTKDRASPLITACFDNHLKVAHLLITNGANINYKDGVCDNCHYCFHTFKKYFFPQYGKTPLHHASKEGNPEVVKLLVQSHANVNVKKNVSTDRIISLVLLHCKLGNVYCQLKIFVLHEIIIIL